MLIDLTKSAQDNAFEIINANNKSRFTPEYITLGTPEETGQLSPNTRINISAQPGTRLVGQATLTFNRLYVNDERARISTVMLKKYHDYETCLTELARQLALHREEIILDRSEFERKTDVLFIKSKVDSLIYAPGNFSIRVIWQNPQQLSEMLPVTDLNGYGSSLDYVVVAIDSDPTKAISEWLLIDESEIQIFPEDETYDPYGDTVLRYHIGDQPFPYSVRILRPSTEVDLMHFLPQPDMVGFQSQRA